MAGLITSFMRKTPQIIKTISPACTKVNLLRNISTSNKLHIAKVKEPAPYFEGVAVIGDEFKTIKLDDYKGKTLLLAFYPLDFTFVCPTELIAIEMKLDTLRSLDTEVVAVSVDSQYSHLAWTNIDRDKGGLGKLHYPLLSDLKKDISREYGVLLDSHGIALRGTFIIDPKGIIRTISINDLPIGRSIDEAIRLIEAIKFVDEVGEVCPANWKKGEKTIKPDPKAAQEYFSSAH